LFNLSSESPISISANDGDEFYGQKQELWEHEKGRLPCLLSQEQLKASQNKLHRGRDV
jgi:hypothetical protein